MSKLVLGKGLGALIPTDVKGTGAFLLDTLWYYSGGILGPVKKILKKKGFQTIAAKEIRMPNNFLRKKINPEKDALKRDMGIKQVHTFASRLVAGKGIWIDIPIYSYLMSLPSRSQSTDSFFRKIMPLTFNAEKCKDAPNANE